MKVTPLDIRRKEFKRSVRGYADEEVDLFLDEVADELERLSQESAELLERLRRQEEHLAGHQQLRGALEKALVSAQIHADETRANAAKEAELTLRDAEIKARGVVSESYTEVQRVQQALVQLKHLEEDFRFKFQSLLEGHLKLLAEPPISMAANAVVVEPPAGMEPAAPPAQPVVSAGPAAPVAPAAPTVQGAPAAPAPHMPFVVPAAFEAVPEYPAAAAPVRPEPPVITEVAVVAEAPVAVEAAVAALSTALTEPATGVAFPAAMGLEPPAVESEAAPVVITEPVLRPPAGLLWPEDHVVPGSDETVTVEQGAVLAGADVTEDQTYTFVVDHPVGAGDESVTLSGNEDPLRSFFFAPQDGESEDSGRGGKSKPRDFEW